MYKNLRMQGYVGTEATVSFDWSKIFYWKKCALNDEQVITYLRVVEFCQGLSWG